MATKKKPRTQCDDILHHLKTHKGITTFDSINMYNVTRLSAVIFKLKEQGYNIVKVYQHGVDYRGKKTKWAEYRLVKEGNE